MQTSFLTPLVESERAATVLEGLRRCRRLVSLTAFGLATAAAYAVAFWAHFELGWPEGYGEVFVGSLLLLVAIRVAVAAPCGLAVHRWRYVGPDEVRKLTLAVVLGSAAFLPLLWGLRLDPAVPAGVLVLEPAFTLLFSTGLWLSYRTAYEIVWHHDWGNGPKRNVLVVGAGEAGEAVVRQMLLHPNGCRPVAFLDDDPTRQGTSIHGVRVLGGTDAIIDIAPRTGAEEVVIAIPSAHPAELRRIVSRCEPTGLPFQVLPGIAEVLHGEVSLSQLREVRIEDLLGREPVGLELPELARDLSEQVVLVTGAAGSIGSELVRQLARNRPGRLVLLDQSETGLYYLELELRDLAPDVEVVPIVADVVDAHAVERVFSLHAPGRVFHAAAYKHVPMMEANAREVLQNNVVGTWRVAESAGRHGAGKFVLVSTDKAVRPANLMGASKRVAEIVVLELQKLYGHTAFGAVRFGNVLDSAGSVIPVFKNQLRAGKPLTVTHPEITRYFMTIAEASQLVLQASLLPELRGRVAMLDMGEPVRILDLARTLVRLSGRRWSDDAVEFVGLRPGEKLHEELVAPGERVFETAHPKVRVLEAVAEEYHLLGRMKRWERLLAHWHPEGVMDELAEIVPELPERAERLTTADVRRLPTRVRNGRPAPPPVRDVRSASHRGAEAGESSRLGDPGQMGGARQMGDAGKMGEAGGAAGD